MSVGVGSIVVLLLGFLYDAYGDLPAELVRSKAGRELSRVHYHTAESFFAPIERQFPLSSDDLLYRSGIVAQLASSSHMLDVGFADPWCARHVGLCVADALGYANATGFAHPCADMAGLATVLTPYWKWNLVHLWDAPAPDDDGFTADEIRSLLRALLNQVYDITGHPRERRAVTASERVEKPADLPDALARARDAVLNGRQALLNVITPY